MNLSLINQYGQTLNSIFVRPRSFFRNLDHPGNIQQAIAFALITHWIGSALGYLWEILLERSLISASSDYIIQALEKLNLPIGENEISALTSTAWSHWLNAGWIILDPLLTLLSILMSSALVFLGARIWITPSVHGRPERISYDSIVQIVCYSMAPSLFLAIPGVGVAVAWIYQLILLCIGISTYYRVSHIRAFIVWLFPKFLVFGIIGIGVVFLLMIFFMLFALLI